MFQRWVLCLREKYFFSVQFFSYQRNRQERNHVADFCYLESGRPFSDHPNYLHLERHQLAK